MNQSDSMSAKKTNVGAKVSQVAAYYHPHTWKTKGLWWTVGLFAVTYCIIVMILGILWSKPPSYFDVREHALELAKNDEKKLVPGYITTATAIGIGNALLDKPGGYTSNDVTPPGVYLDNISNWEFGALTELRDLAHSLRNDFSRSQTQSVEDKDLQVAQPSLNYNNDSWMFPSTEAEYRAGIQGLQRYLNRLADENAYDGQFFTRSDNLRSYLQVVEKRLGNLAQQLAASVGQTRDNIDLAGDPKASQSTATPEQAWVKTPWLKIDDIFFEARGYTWALLHTLQALEIDFKGVLNDKNALVSLRHIIHELENTQQIVWSPMIMNGTGFGLLANHSLVMASYISRANAAIIDLRNLLSQG